MTVTTHYPAFLDLRNRFCLVVGDSDLAREKADGLSHCGARVLRKSTFDPKDASGAFLIVADVDELSGREIFEFGDRERIFVNVVDKPGFCSFILPAIVRRGDLSVAISTGGGSPSLAGWLRRKLEGILGDEYSVLLSELRRTRDEIKQEIPGYQDRKAFYYGLLDSGILETARDSGTKGVREVLARSMQETSK